MGPSGSGKSTLLYILGCLDRPTSGTYLLEGRDVSQASDKELSRLRANQIGFVFQTFNLLPHLSLVENVALPFLYSALDDQTAKERVMSAIQRVGLADRLTHRPTELSGGEMQRVAIARALAIEPNLILADEPTGNLDSKTSLEILALFQRLNESGSTIVMVTHDREVASYAQRVLLLKDGKFI
jgi:putative ABC transport system ATP-binding protein